MTHASKSLIDREADARFWAQTHYKIGQKLDPADPTDRKMIPVWLDVWGKVKREDARGQLRITYNHPEVERGLDDAETASLAVAGHLDAAAGEPDPAIARQHAAAAAAAAGVAAASAQRAAQRQPPTVSPIVADHAAAGAARAAKLPPPTPVTPNLPPGHPAASSEAASPVLPPGIEQEDRPYDIADVQIVEMVHGGHAGMTEDDPRYRRAIANIQQVNAWNAAKNHAGTASAAVQDAARAMTQTLAQARPVAPPTHGDPAARPGPAAPASPPATARDQLAVAQAIRAPAVAAQVHQDAAEDAAANAMRGRAPPPEGGMHPRAVGSIRELAARLAADASGSFVGVDYSPAEQWLVPMFRSPGEAMAWYENAAGQPDHHRYLAVFDKTAHAWPGPILEIFGSARAIGADEEPGPKEGPPGRSYGAIAAVGAGAVVIALLAALAGRRNGNGRSGRYS